MQYELKAKQGNAKSSLVLDTETNDLACLKHRLQELEEVSLIMDGVRTIEKQDGVLQLVRGDDHVTRPKRSRGGKEGTVYQSQEGVRNLELENEAVDTTSRSRHRVLECSKIVLRGSQYDSQALQDTVSALQTLQDVYQWTGGSYVTIDTLLEEAGCTPSNEIKTRLEALPAATVDEKRVADVLEELLELSAVQLDKVLDGKGETSIEKSVHSSVTSLIPDIPDVTGPIARMLHFVHKSPMNVLKDQLKESQHIYSTTMSTASHLHSQQKKLMVKLTLPKVDDVEGVAAEVISLAERRASALEQGMTTICERWPQVCPVWRKHLQQIEEAEGRLRASLSSFTDNTNDLCQVVKNIQEHFRQQAELIKADSEKLEAVFTAKDNEYNDKLLEDEKWLTDSLKELERNGERIDETWMHVCETVDDLCRYQEERLRLVGSHIEMIREMNKRQYDLKMMDSVANEHMKLLEELHVRYTSIEKGIGNVPLSIQSALNGAEDFMQVCLGECEEVFKSDAKCFSDMHVAYCELVGDLLLRRKNRLGMIDVEGGLLKMKIDTATMSDAEQSSPRHHTKADMLELSRLREEKLRVMAYIREWEERLDARNKWSALIFEKCGIPDPMVDLTVKFQQTQAEYDAKQSELFSHMKELVQGYMTFAEETSTCQPIRVCCTSKVTTQQLSAEEYRRQHSEAIGVLKQC